MFLKFSETFQFGVVFVYFREQDSIKNLLFISKNYYGILMSCCMC